MLAPLTGWVMSRMLPGAMPMPMAESPDRVMLTGWPLARL